MVEEIKKPEEVPKEETKEPEKKLSILEEAGIIRDEILKAKDELKSEKDELLKLKTDQVLASTAGGHVEVPKPKRLEDKEYFEAYEKGDVNPFKSDGNL